MDSAPQADGKGMPPAPIFRKTFVLSTPVKQARLYICGLGYYELHLNGRKVGDHVLDPAFTRYDRRVLYVTYDVTEQLKAEFNAVAVILGNGWYDMDAQAAWDFNKATWRARPTLRCQLEVTFYDGSTRTIASDETWRVAPSPILFNCIRQGETYDARREIPGWNTPDLSDADWSLAKVSPGPKGTLGAQMIPPIKVMQTLKPVKITAETGRVRVRLARTSPVGPPEDLRPIRSEGGHAVRRTPQRRWDHRPEGHRCVHTKSTPFQTDTYILKGEGTETWEPRFVYHGFQYVQVTGLPDKPDDETILGRVAHTAFDRAGVFECSNDLFSKIQRCTLWSYVGNFHGYPTDCPHREKNGWTGAHPPPESGFTTSTRARLHEMDDRLQDEQRDSGELPGIVRTAGWATPGAINLPGTAPTS